jgi:hypothetical protein
LREVDGQELVTWRVLESIDPFGQKRDDIHYARLMALIANVMGSKKTNSKAWTADDFILDFTPEEQDPVESAEAIEAIVRRWVDNSNLRFSMSEQVH